MLVIGKRPEGVCRSAVTLIFLNLSDYYMGIFNLCKFSRLSIYDLCFLTVIFELKFF